MEHFYKNIHGWFTFPKLYSLIAKDIPNNGIFVEIGVWKGKSLSYFVVESINNNKNLNIYAVDTWEGSKEHQEGNWAHEECIKNKTLFEEFNKNILPIKNNVKVLKMKSTEAAEKFKDNTIDAVFIDGSHEYNDVLQDLNAWYPKVKSGGFFCGHDYCIIWPDVTRAVNDFFSNKKETIINEEECWITKKI